MVVRLTTPFISISPMKLTVKANACITNQYLTVSEQPDHDRGDEDHQHVPAAAQEVQPFHEAVEEAIRGLAGSARAAAGAEEAVEPGRPRLVKGHPQEDHQRGKEGKLATMTVMR